MEEMLVSEDEIEENYSLYFWGCWLRFFLALKIT